MLNNNDRETVAALYARLVACPLYSDSVIEELKAAMRAEDLVRIKHWCDVADVIIKKIKDIYIYTNEKMCKRVWQQWYQNTGDNGWCVSEDGMNFIIYDADEYYDGERERGPTVLARYRINSLGNIILVD